MRLRKGQAWRGYSTGHPKRLMDVSFTIPDSGFAYFNIHLQYGLRKEGGYAQDIDGNAFDPDSGKLLAPNHCEHVFSVLGSVEGSSSIYNLNDFKGGPGVAGTVVEEGTGNPVAGAIVVLKSHRGKTELTQVTDANGDYFIPFIRTGKPGVYELWMMPPSGAHQNRNVIMKKNGFSVENFTVPGE